MTSPGGLKIEDDRAGLRIDRFLAERYPNASRSYFQQLIADGRITVNGVPVRKAARLTAGDRIEVDWPPPEPPALLPETFNLPLLYQDDSLLALNKPAGLTVHPGAGNWSGTLVNALLGYDYERFSRLAEGDVRPGIVHRLDKETSGVIVVAKTAEARRRLSGAFAARRVSKCYLALASGALPQTEQTVDAPIGRHPVHRKRMAILRAGGRAAVTHFRVLAAASGVSLVLARPVTGRTHQIRVHLAHLGCPVVGDKVYARREAPQAPRHLLHAWRLQLPHPTDRRPLRLAAPLPSDFREVAANTGIDLDSALAAIGPDQHNGPGSASGQ